MNNQPFNVCLMGASLRTGNLGVSALTVSLVKIILKLKPMAKISLIATELEDGVQEAELAQKKVKLDTISLRLSPKASKHSNLFYILLLCIVYKTAISKSIRRRIALHNPCVQRLLEADVVGQISGGDSFSDIYGLKRLLFIVLPALSAILLNKKLVLLPQTYGPYDTRVGKKLAMAVLKNSTHIISRDLQGIDYLNKKFDIQHGLKKIQFCPDVAFHLDATKPKKIQIIPSAVNLQKKTVIGLNISGLLFIGGYNQNNSFGLRFDYKEFIQQTIHTIMEKTDSNILIVPHTAGAEASHAETDQSACNEVYKSIGKLYADRIFMVEMEKENYNQSEIKHIIGICDFFIGSRMHACIAALSQGIPTIGVAYSKKFKGVFDSIGVSYMVVDARETSMNKTIYIIVDSILQGDNIRSRINKLIDETQMKIESVFMDILETNERS